VAPAARSKSKWPLGSAPARLLRHPQGASVRRPWAARHSQGKRPALWAQCPLGAQPLPRVLERAASNAADPTAFDRPGTGYSRVNQVGLRSRVLLSPVGTVLTLTLALTLALALALALALSQSRPRPTLTPNP
jgi:hypothetical protein